MSRADNADLNITAVINRRELCVILGPNSEWMNWINRGVGEEVSKYGGVNRFIKRTIIFLDNRIVDLWFRKGFLRKF